MVPKTQQSCPANNIYRLLRAVNIIKEKRCGKIKGRTCEDGSLQSTYIPLEEAVLPTIALESLFVSLFIGVHEGIAVHRFNFTGAYLHSSLPNDKVVHIKFES